MQYTIQAVAPDTRNYDTKFGAMTSYKIKLKEEETPVELSQKASTPAPQAGATLQGTIEQGQFGPKFKKEYNQGGFPSTNSYASNSQGSRTTSGTGRTFDTFTMYLSYAKDIAVGLIGSKTGYSDEQFSKILEDVLAGGKVLYEGRPDAEDKEPQKDATPTDEEVNSSNLDDIFGKSEVVDTEEFPFK